MQVTLSDLFIANNIDSNTTVNRTIKNNIDKSLTYMTINSKYLHQEKNELSENVVP